MTVKTKKAKSGIEKKIDRIESALNRIELGQWSEFTISQCCDYIAWLARFKKAPEEVWGRLCERATRILDNRCC